MSDEIFFLKEEHIKLLKNAYVSWEDCEFGAPTIDCKRPYGNSNVYHDIAEILGYPYDDEDDSVNDYDKMRRIHEETQTALQIFLYTGRMEAGTYKRDGYSSSRWNQLSAVAQI